MTAVGEIANICLLHTQECFLHRNDYEKNSILAHPIV